MLLSYPAFRPTVFFTSKEGTTLANHPFLSNQTKVIMGGLIPDRYFLIQGQVTKKAMITKTTGTTQTEQQPSNQITKDSAEKQTENIPQETDQKQTAEVEQFLTRLSQSNTEEEEENDPESHEPQQQEPYQRKSKDWDTKAKIVSDSYF